VEEERCVGFDLCAWAMEGEESIPMGTLWESEADHMPVSFDVCKE